MTPRPAVLIASALVLVTTACGAPSAPLPPGPQVVDVTMREYSYEYDAAALFTGRVEFRVRNAGREPHRLALIFLAKGLPPLEEQLRGSERRVVVPLADLPTMEPGRRNVFSVGLPPGRWGLLCYYQGADGVTGGTKGMFSEFRVA